MRAPRLAPAAGARAFSTVVVPVDPTPLALASDDLFRPVAGAGLFRRLSSAAANPTAQGLSLRAIAPSGAGRALVTLDGEPLNDPFGGWVLWSQAPPSSLARIRIVRGGGAGPYGAGALTGTVTLEERYDGPGSGLLDAGVGERGGRSLSGRMSLDGGGPIIFLAGSARDEEGYTPVREGRGPVDAPLTFRARSAVARVSTDLGDAEGAARVYAYAEARGTGVRGGHADASGNGASFTVARLPGRNALGWRLQAWVHASDFAQTSLTVAPGRAVATPALDQAATPAFGAGVNGAVRGSRGGLSWEAGLDVRLAEGQTHERFRYVSGAFTRGRLAGGQTSVGGAYGEAAWVQGPWTVTAGVRADRWTANRGERAERDLATGVLTLSQRPRDRDGVEPTARVGFQRRLAAPLVLRGAAYAGFRPPTLNELHRPFRVGADITEANPALRPEQLRGAELGLDLGSPSGAMSVSLTAFASRLENAVTNVTLGMGPGVFPGAGFVPAGGVFRQRRNAAAVDAQGLEGEARLQANPAFSAGLSVSVTDARMDGGRAAPQLTGRRPAQAPVVSLGWDFTWTPHPLVTVAGDWRWEGARFEDDLNRRRLSPGGSLNLSARWRLKPGLQAWLALDNATNARIESSEGADGLESFAAPRTVRLGMTLVR